MLTSDRSAATESASEMRWRGRVLVVDDDPQVRSVLELALAGHEVVTATDGAEALASIARGDAFDLVLCDVAMPRMGGVELWMEVSLSHPELVPGFVLMTGGVMTRGDRLFLGAGAVQVLYKPIPARVLRDLVRARVVERSA